MKTLTNPFLNITASLLFSQGIFPIKSLEAMHVLLDTLRNRSKKKGLVFKEEEAKYAKHKLNRVVPQMFSSPKTYSTEIKLTVPKSVTYPNSENFVSVRRPFLLRN